MTICVQTETKLTVLLDSPTFCMHHITRKIYHKHVILAPQTAIQIRIRKKLFTTQVLIVCLFIHSLFQSVDLILPPLSSLILFFLGHQLEWRSEAACESGTCCVPGRRHLPTGQSSECRRLSCKQAHLWPHHRPGGRTQEQGAVVSTGGFQF